MKRKKNTEPDKLWGSRALLGFIAIAALVFGGIFYVGLRRPPANAANQESEIPPYYATEEAAKPFPATLDPAAFKGAAIVKSYEVARRIPGVLAQQPCYCGCERRGHRGLLDCFRTNHAASCDVCTKEALLADQMKRDGRTPQEIRAAIMRGDWKNLNQTNGR